ERLRINDATGDFSSFEISSQENIKKNHFAALSLLNAASQQLILSYPKIANEGEDDVSVYLKEWMDLGVKQVDKTRE
ncbi:hypothetical protein ACXWOD_11605, partial [Streptococcus pyogenes]